MTDVDPRATLESIARTGEAGECDQEGKGMSGMGYTCWRKSTYSNPNTSQCVEVAEVGVVLVRDTTDRDGVTLGFAPEAWAAFTCSLR